MNLLLIGDIAARAVALALLLLPIASWRETRG